jgi:hypothetical protein
MPQEPAKPERELDDKVEDLAQRIVQVVNTASPEQRQDLREYAMELLRDGTEATDAPGAPPTNANASANAAATNPLGIGLLLGVLSLPALLLFPPVGLVLLAIAVVLGVWGVLATLLRR